MNLMLKVLTLNLHKGFSSFNRRFVLHELRDAIRATSADLVFLQEVVGNHQSRALKYKNWPEQPQYEFLADSIWNDYAYGKNAVYTEGHHGNAILSKWPIKNWQNIDISQHTSERRGILHCEIDVKGFRLDALCVHLGLLEKFRQIQLSKLEDFIRNDLMQSPHIVVAGDFNDWRNRARANFGERLKFLEVSECLRGKPMRSFPSFFPILSLDRIYCRGLQPVDCHSFEGKIWSRLSDHRPISAELVFKNDSASEEKVDQ